MEEINVEYDEPINQHMYIYVHHDKNTFAIQYVRVQDKGKTTAQR